MTKPSHAFEIEQVRRRLEAGNGGYEVVHTSPGLEVGVYVLVAPEPDHQQPHADDELYVVLEGSGVLNVEGEAIPVAEGQSVFVPAGAVHQFTAYEGLSVLVIFARTGTARAERARHALSRSAGNPQRRFVAATDSRRHVPAYRPGTVTTYAVKWREPDGQTFVGRLALGPRALRLDGRRRGGERAARRAPVRLRGAARAPDRQRRRRPPRRPPRARRRARRRRLSRRRRRAGRAGRPGARRTALRPASLRRAQGDRRRAAAGGRARARPRARRPRAAVRSR